MSVFGIILVFLPPVIIRAKNDILNKDNFLKQIYIPSLIGLILLMISSYMLLIDETDEIFFQILIGVTAIFSIALNFGVIFMSMLRMRWAAD